MWMVRYRLADRAGLGAVGKEWWRLGRRDLDLSKGYSLKIRRIRTICSKSGIFLVQWSVSEGKDCKSSYCCTRSTDHSATAL